MKISANNIRRAFGTAGLALKKAAPDILVAAGVVGVMASTVMAIKATPKAKQAIEELKADKAQLEECKEMFKDQPEKYTVEDARKDTAIIYTHCAVKIVKAYAPAVILGATSLYCIVGSHMMLKQRNAALAAAYTGLSSEYKKYRERVAKKVGEEAEKQIFFGAEETTVKENVVKEDGTTETVEKTVMTRDPGTYSEYARCFDNTNPNFVFKYRSDKGDNEANLRFIRQAQNWANEILKSRGWLTLNEVYETLGFKPTKAGALVGWRFNEDNPTGDNTVDFGLYDLYNAKAHEFINGTEQFIWIDFNVDGVIFK